MQGIKLSKTFFFIVSVISFLFFILVIFPHSTFALEENFEGTGLDSFIWQSYENGGKISVSSEWLELSSNAATFPFIHTKENPFPKTGDFSLELKIQYTSVNSRGDGITIGNRLPSNNITDSYWAQYDTQVFLFNIWQDSVSHFNISYRSCETNLICESSRKPVFQLSVNNMQPNIIQIDYKNNCYSLFFNGDLVFTSMETLRRPTTLWIGNPVNHNSAAS